VEEAQQAFRFAMRINRSPDGRFEFDTMDMIEKTGAYYIDLVSQDEYVASFGGNLNACFAWFNIGQRKEFDGDRDSALAAYKRSAELGKDEGANHMWRLSQWRLVELGKTSAESP
jgi:hypothetical protein